MCGWVGRLPVLACACSCALIATARCFRRPRPSRRRLVVQRSNLLSVATKTKVPLVFLTDDFQTVSKSGRRKL